MTERVARGRETSRRSAVGEIARAEMINNDVGYTGKGTRRECVRPETYLYKLKGEVSCGLPRLLPGGKKTQLGSGRKAIT